MALLSFQCSKKSIDIILDGRYRVSSYKKFVPGFGIEKHTRHSLRVATQIRVKEMSILTLKVDSVLEIILSTIENIKSKPIENRPQSVNPFAADYVMP